ncbi:uncharacterized protein LOC142980746 [Anticarsia gemmatalis]|uniref:uncharacterized protein LOC142980746 n=1 Tax=Anticarsia gemmatalis TaxID=129554 RepID=UPI003F775344
MLYFIIIVCFISSGFSKKQSTDIYLGTKMLIRQTPQDYVVYNELNISPNKPFNIYLTEYTAEDIKCWMSGYPKQINTFEYVYPHSVINVPRLNTDMNGVWKCNVKENSKNIPKFLLLPIHVVGASSPQMVLVNRVILPTRVHSIGLYSASYEYSDGDAIDVACVSSDSDCVAHIDFEKQPVYETVQVLSSEFSVGFHTNLSHDHKNTYFICKCIYPNETSTSTSIKTTFVLQTKFEEVTHLEINGREIKGTRAKGKYNYFQYNYAYTNNLPINITTYTNRKDIVLKMTYYNCNISNHQNNGTRSSLQFKPNKYSTLIHDAKVKSTQYSLQETVAVTFIPVKMGDENNDIVYNLYDSNNREFFEVTVNQRFHITFKGAWAVRNIICKSFRDETIFGEYNRTPDVVAKSCLIQIPNATYDMSDKWMCITRDVNEFGTTKYIYFDVYIKDAKPQQTVLINDIVQKARRSSPGLYQATYYYLDGDDIKVSCISPKPSCSVKLESQHGPLIGLKWSSSSNFSIHLWFRLRSEHNNTHMICICTCELEPEITQVDVKFVLKENFENIVNVTINNMIVRGNLKKDKKTHVYYNYGYYSQEQLEIKSYIYNNSLRLISADPRDQVGNKIEKKIKPTPNWKEEFYAKLGDTVIEHVWITFTMLLKEIHTVDSMPLRTNLDQSNNIIMKYYHCDDDYGSLSYVYEYMDGENVEVRCYKTAEFDKTTYLSLNHTALPPEENMNERVKKLTLTSDHDNTSILCVLKEGVYTEGTSADKILGEINIFFRLQTSSVATTTSSSYNKKITTTTITPNSLEADGVSESTLTIIGIVVFALLICVAIFAIYKMRKRKRLTQNIQQHHNDEAIPSFPAQLESNYAVPRDQTNANIIYSLPEETLYTKPIPKCFRNPQNIKITNDTKHTGPELIYASLENNKTSTNKVIGNDKVVYAEVLSSGEQNRTYDNVFSDSNYVNSSRVEYVEPTYCEINNKNK